ncbi:MAG: hypothetical protein AAGC67_16155 [Myxococcota bacterium]
MAAPRSSRLDARAGVAGHRLPVDLSGHLAVTAPGAREPFEIRGHGAQIVIATEHVRDLRVVPRGGAGRRTAALLETLDVEAIVEVRGTRIARRKPAAILPWRLDLRGLVALLIGRRR